MVEMPQVLWGCTAEDYTWAVISSPAVFHAHSRHLPPQDCLTPSIFQPMIFKINQLKEVLGHKKMETTYKYVHLDRTNLAREMEQGAL
jgi:hypothetical protein